MKQHPTNLLKEALRLPPEARAALAAALLDSLDQEVDQDSEAAWAAEIDRRLLDLDSGTVRPIPGRKPVLKSPADNAAGGRSSPRRCLGSAGGVQVVPRPE